jgi:protein O-GlcNAc transferase
VTVSNVAQSGLELHAQGHFAQALPLLTREIRSDSIAIHRALADCYLHQGKIAEAVKHMDRVLAATPEDAGLQSLRLVSSYFDPNLSDIEVLNRHTDWAKRFAGNFAPQNFANSRDPGRKLKIGYLCSTIRSGVTMALFGPLLERHDRNLFTIYCYNNTPAPDGITLIIRGFADAWREIGDLNDAAAVDLIRRDEIDILIDLDLHLPPNRIGLIARKSAPVQAALIQYPGTSGLAAMDYIFTDRYMLAAGCEKFFTEKLVAIDTLWIFRPRGPGRAEEESAYAVTPPPSLSTRYVTFGSLNNAPKINAALLRTWNQILLRIPNSRLLLQMKGSAGGEIQLLRECGLPLDRVDVIDSLPQVEYIRRYQQIDIALDPFPYGGGGGTAMDALWAGLPLITLAGNRPTSRYGTSLLMNLGLTQFIAKTPEQYIDIAVSAAEDVIGRSELRRTLRTRMAESILMNEARYARQIEAGYRGMWKRWCGSF